MNAGEVREAIKVISASRSRQLRDVDIVALRVLRDAARELLTIREAGALIIVPDEMLLERIAAPIIEALYLLVDITVEPYTWDTAVDKAAAGVLDALRDAMPPEDTNG